MHGVAVVFCHVLTDTRCGPLSARSTQLLAAAVVTVHMINATIASALHDNDLSPEAHLEALHNSAALFGSAFKAVDTKANDPNVLSSVHHPGKILCHTVLKFACLL